MTSFYKTPLRVYILLGFLGILGVYSGLKLPISLFPNSSKPTVVVNLSYGSATAQEFKNTYGSNFENLLQNSSAGKTEVERTETFYNAQDVSFRVMFKWGTDAREALREIQTLANSFASQFPLDVRDSLRVWTWGENTGFLAVSYYSDTRDLDEVYDILEPILSSQLTKVKDAEGADLWNPSRKEVQITLNPEKMALFGLYPRDISGPLTEALNGNTGGSINIGLNKFNVILPRQAQGISNLEQVLIPTGSGRAIHLGDVAQIDLGIPMASAKGFKTSGAPSLILEAEPRPGGNIKRMAEEILEIVKKIQPTLPSDIKYKVLVDPSEFIRSAVGNVFREVLVAALLAVCVLFLFIGNIKNVATAAIEIPLSIVLAFILMRLTGINLNLISLGGLALSAGMNVDASVVVMENIFRRFEESKGPLNYAQRFNLVCEAVNEVKFPVIASTIASLVVFLPLAMTSGLSNALLGDLAMAVVFSHCFSAVVALILVPTVRLHLMATGDQSSSHSPIEKYLTWTEGFYVKNLDRFIKSGAAKKISYVSVVLVLIALSFLIIPRLPKEIIGRPDTDWVGFYAVTQGNTLVKQMEAQSEELEAQLMAKFGDQFLYTFAQTRNPNSTYIMARLKDKTKMTEIWHKIEKEFPNTPQMYFSVGPWNPSELSIPNPPDIKILVRGGNDKQRARAAEDVLDLLQQNKSFPSINSTPNFSHQESIAIRPHLDQWPYLVKDRAHLLPSDLADISKVGTVGRKVGYLPVDGRIVSTVIQYPTNRFKSLEDLASFPIGVVGKLLPLKSLASVQLEETEPDIFSMDQKPVNKIEARMHDEDKAEGAGNALKAQKLIEDWLAQHPLKGGVSVNFDDAKIEMNEALGQLEVAVGLSILLIFLTMILQFGDVMSALFVLVAIPLGFIGVLSSLYIFKSTLSLNSVLGVILLNGIAVANSIILVDFLKKLVEKGMDPHSAALSAARKRLRPILMTSITTALGMLPVALGLGEGGRILQPLGIAVVGGLGFSMLTTLFLVPALQVGYLQWKRGKIKVDYHLPQEMVL